MSRIEFLGARMEKEIILKDQKKQSCNRK